MENKSLNELPDCQLVELFISKKEKGVFEVLYERYKNMIYAYVRRFLYSAPEDIAGEIMHEIFIKVFLDLPGLREFHAFKVWVFQIARTMCLKYIRSDRIKTVSLEEEGRASQVNNFKDQRINIEEDYLRDEVMGVIGNEVNLLSPEVREMIILKIFNKSTFDEVSQILKIPVRTVKYKVSKAFDGINRKLKREGYL